MSSLNREEAQALVQGISASHGFVDYEHWQAMGEWDMDRKRIFELAFLAKDKLIGSAVITLAKNLYSSNARFLFELLQNCEDNHYRRATERGEEPFVLFEVYPSHIIIECNEDGFTKTNLSAICNIGRSSKSGTQAYIGEKGIGFKSVFKVAYKAVIQSGNLCFSFTHRKGDSGMGMISPQWEGEVHPGEQGRTRITLWLHEDDSEDVFASISEQFEAIHEEMLLFMKKIKRIVVKNYDDDHRLKHSSTYSRRNGTGRLVSTERLRREGESKIHTTKHFHLTSYTATGLPKSETREYNDEALESESYARSKIILAFPLTERSVPVLEKQWLFSFLPVAQTGFKFIIQADFVTSANRESIETTSSRNRVLGQRIPDAFVTAVLQMCEHESLQYQWMRYLPSTDGENAWGAFWATVVDNIKERLEMTPVLRPASLGSLRQICKMRRHVAHHLDQDGVPLFADIAPEKYVSPGYAHADLLILETYGLSITNMKEILKRVKHDLQNETSRIRSYESKDWHTRAAKLLQRPFETLSGDRIRDLKSMMLLPLRNGSWTSINDGAVYYAELNKLTIPEGLQLRVIDTSASNNPERRKLFDLLRVQTASVDLIRDQICQRYRQTGSWSLSLRTSLADLHFLYLTQNTAAIVEERLGIKVHTNDPFLTDPTREDVYITSDDILGASRLLAPMAPGPNVDDGAPGHSVLFLDDYYLDNPPSDPPAKLPKWIDWLHDSMHIRRHARLVDKTSRNMSEVCRYVAEHRPQKFMSLLNRTWKFENFLFERNETFLKQLRKTRVLCRGDRFYELSETFLPTNHLEKTAKRFLADGDPFRWLQLGLASDEDFQSQVWQQCFSGLGISRRQDDLEFGLSLLGYLEDTATDASHDLCHSSQGSNGHRRIRDLYVFLDAQVRASDDGESARTTVRETLANSCLVFIPAGYESEEAEWALPEQCVWTAPVRHPRRMYALDGLYARMPGEPASSPSGYSLETFFRSVVGVLEWDWELAVNELESHKKRNADFDCIVDLYKWLSRKKNASVVENVRHAFESKGLVYKPNEEMAWHKSSDCLWTTATIIPGKAPINNDGDYDGLESFFLDVIGVQKMTLRMLYDKLSDPDLDISLDELKGDLLEFSALLAREDRDSIDAPRMCRNCIFPVRKPDGEVVLLDGDDHFAIIDRAPLAASFRDKALLLDFDMEQVRGLEHFIRWAGLEDRYISTSVKEIFVPDRTSSRPISEPERQIRKKAGALLSIAKCCRSPRVANGYDELYQLLRNCDTLETKKITTTLLLHQGGTEPIKHEKDNGVALCIDGSSEVMKVFVPRKISDREACFQSKLPKCLFEWIMTHPDTNIMEACADDLAKLLKEKGTRAVQAVLNTRTCGLESILLELGVPDVDAAYVDDDSDDNTEQSEEESVVDDGVHEAQPLNEHHQAEVDNIEELYALSVPASSDTEDERAPTPAGSTTSGSRVENESIAASMITIRESLRVASAPVQPVDYHPPVASPEPSPDVASQRPTPYRLLLEALVNRASGLEFPSRGAFDMSEISEALPGQSGDDPVNSLPFLRPFGRRERDKMVGAAGELFVFKLLRHIEPSLPGFDIDNWQSNIRGYASAHPQFAAISSWRGSETADITYRDHTGTFTSFLADKGYLDSYDVEALRRAKPMYYLEVKSTPYPFSTSFFMNRSQFRRMQDCSQSVPGQEDNLDRVYIILRVFRLGTDSASVGVLVDPEGMRRRGELNFAAESWRVRPSTGQPETPAR